MSTLLIALIGLGLTASASRCQRLKRAKCVNKRMVKFGCQWDSKRKMCTDSYDQQEDSFVLWETCDQHDAMCPTSDYKECTKHVKELCDRSRDCEGFAVYKQIVHSPQRPFVMYSSSSSCMKKHTVSDYHWDLYVKWTVWDKKDDHFVEWGKCEQNTNYCPTNNYEECVKHVTDECGRTNGGTCEGFAVYRLEVGGVNAQRGYITYTGPRECMDEYTYEDYHWDLYAKTINPTWFDDKTTYRGCYVNNDEDRVNGHVWHKSWSECRDFALASGNTLFGMEYPQGSTTRGDAQCLLLDRTVQYASMDKVPDSECEAEGLSEGKRLGSGWRLAVYEIPDRRRMTTFELVTTATEDADNNLLEIEAPGL